MAVTQAQIEAVVQIVIDEFDANPALFRTFLGRARLEAELDQLASAERVIRTDFAGDQDEFNTALAANQQAQAIKQSEIDSL